MFVMVAVVAWLLVRGLREREMRLAGNLLELQGTRDWLGATGATRGKE